MSKRNPPAKKPNAVEPREKAAPTNQANVAPSQASRDEREPNGAENKRESAIGSFLRRLSVGEWLTFLVGLGSLLVAFGSYWVSYQAYIASKDSADIKKAISNLASLAEQTKRQADNSDRQLKILSGQADDQKRQTAAIQSQTIAITDSSDAAILSATAQRRAADVISATSSPEVRFGGLQIEGIKGEPDKAGLVKFTVQPFFVNIGTVALVPGATEMHILFSKALPARPIIKNTIVFGGNDIAVIPDRGFSAETAQEMSVEKDIRDKVLRKELRIFVWGRTTYASIKGEQFHKCFAVQLTASDDTWTKFALFKINEPAYRCED